MLHLFVQRNSILIMTMMLWIACIAVAEETCPFKEKAAATRTSAAGVGSKVLHEDDQIKVWDLTLWPGEVAPVHTHEYPYAFVVLNGSTIEVASAEGESLTSFTAEAGDTLAFDLIGEELVNQAHGYRIPTTHSARNIGKGLFREVLIEKKKI